MRILFTIPHYFDSGADGDRRHGARSGDAAARTAALTDCLHALHQLYGRAQCMMQLVRRRTQPANESLTAELRVVICTTGDRHLLDRLPIDPVLFEHQPASAEPEMLGFECRDVLRDRSGEYDYYCYLEDDLVLHDPWLFSKLAWFTRQAGDENLLLPNRFERGPRPLVHKAYLDGDLAEHVAAAHQNVHETPELRSVLMGVPLLFQRPLNPHAGCFFLSAEQMARWMGRPYFLDRDCSFIGPLESAATLGILRTFRIYKPARQNASFLEIEHHGTRFLSQLRRPIAVDEEK